MKNSAAHASPYIRSLMREAAQAFGALKLARRVDGYWLGDMVGPDGDLAAGNSDEVRLDDGTTGYLIGFERGSCGQTLVSVMVAPNETHIIEPRHITEVI
jgi:hypothetical protein